MENIFRFLLLISLCFVLCVGLNSPSCITDSDCSGFGTCVYQHCRCVPERLGSNCSVPVVASDCNSRFCFAFAVVETDLYVRMSGKTEGYVGVILDCEIDGMSGGDTWAGWIYNNTAEVADRYTYNLSYPRPDWYEDLTHVWGWKENGWIHVGFQRKLNTNHSIVAFQDRVISEHPGDSFYITWALGPSITKVEIPPYGLVTKLSMHTIADTGAFRVDFAAGELEFVPHSVKWGKTYIPWLVGILVIFICGPLLQPLPRIPLPVFKYSLYCIRSWSAATFSDWLLCFLYLIVCAVSLVVAIREYAYVFRPFDYVLGHIANIHLALSMVPVTQHSVLFLWMGVPFDRAIKYHRFLSLAAFVFVLAHTVTQLVRWGTTSAGQDGPLYQGESIYSGALAFCLWIAVCVLSVQVVRRNMHEFFYTTHVLCNMVALIFAMIHTTVLRWLMLGPLVLWGVDWAARLYQTAFQYRVSVLSSTVFTTVSIPRVVKLHLQVKPGICYEPGQYVFVRIPQIRRMEWHPITIASADRHNGQMTLLIQEVGTSSWSSNLADYVAHAQRVYSPLDVQLYGPFGLPSLSYMEYSRLVLIGGGIGITPMFALLDRILTMDSESSTPCSIREVHLVWIFKDRSVMGWMEMEQLFVRTNQTKHVQIFVYFHETKSNVKNNCGNSALDLDSDEFFEVIDLETMDVESLYPAVPVSSHPNLGQLISALAKKESSQDPIACYVCGPEGMVRDVKNMVRPYSHIHLHDEIYTF